MAVTEQKRKRQVNSKSFGTICLPIADWTLHPAFLSYVELRLGVRKSDIPFQAYRVGNSTRKLIGAALNYPDYVLVTRQTVVKIKRIH